jgi:hypothetical protein
MSVVENETVESSGAEEREETKTITEESLHSVASFEDSSAKTMASMPLTQDDCAKELDVNGAVNFSVRAWFEKLDDVERAAALGFVNGPFLSAFLALSTPSGLGTSSSRKSCY